jgi:heat shock protein HtpX
VKQQIKTLALLAGLTILLVTIGALIGKTALIGFTAFALLLNLGMYFFSDRLVLKMHGAKEVSVAEAPRLHAMVEDLARRAEIPKPRVCIIPSAQPNAFATGRNPQNGVVAVTAGIMDLLTERELRGVIAHELAHIRNRDILVCTIAAAIAGAVTSIAHMLQFSALFGGNDDEENGSLAGSLALAFVAPFAATLVQLGISRSREFMADQTGAQISNDPEALAGALEKLEHAAAIVPAASANPATASLFIVNPLTGVDGLVRLFSTHPSTRERVRRLRALSRGRLGMAA